MGSPRRPPEREPESSRSGLSAGCLAAGVLHALVWLGMAFGGTAWVMRGHGELLEGAALPWVTRHFLGWGMVPHLAIALVGAGILATLGRATHPAWYRWTVIGLLLGAHAFALVALLGAGGIPSAGAPA